MLPFFLNISVSNLELSKPKMEYVSSYTTIENDNSEFLANIDQLLESKIGIFDYRNYVGTTIISNSTNKFSLFEDEDIRFFGDDFDFIIKMPPVKTISRKFRVNSVSKFIPKVSI